jgi:hypothetical protein
MTHIAIQEQLNGNYAQTPAHSFLQMLDPKNGPAPGDPA